MTQKTAVTQGTMAVNAAAHDHCNRLDVCTGSQGLVDSRQGVERGASVAC